MKAQRKVLFAKTKAKDIEQEAIHHYRVLRTMKMVDRILDLDYKVWEQDFNECKERAKAWRSVSKRMQKSLQKSNTLLLKQLRQRKEFEQQLVA